METINRLRSHLRRPVVAYMIVALAVASSATFRLSTVTATYGAARPALAAMEYRGETAGTFLLLSRVERSAETPSEYLNVIFTGQFNATSSHTDRNVIEVQARADNGYGISDTFSQAADSAWVAANVIAGTPVETKPVVVVQHVSDSSSMFEPGDRIVAVDGVAPWLAMLHKRLEKASTVLVARNDDLIELDASTVTFDHVQLNDSVRLADPRPSLIKVAEASGPSGGLIDALTYLDAITDGDLTGGMTVAGTGTIAPNGKVGIIGYVDHKTEAAIRHHADVLFVPEANERVAREKADGNVTVVAVSSLADAVMWLCEHGATSTSCP